MIQRHPQAPSASQLLWPAGRHGVTSLAHCLPGRTVHRDIHASPPRQAPLQSPPPASVGPSPQGALCSHADKESWAREGASPRVLGLAVREAVNTRHRRLLHRRPLAPRGSLTAKA